MKLHSCWLGLWLAVSVCQAVQPQAAQPPAKQAAPGPNIVLILADDLGYGDLGCYGCPDIKTPHLDALAKQGVRMTSFYSNGPECSPTRTGLMTGRYQARVGGLECAIGLGGVGRYDDAIRLAEKRELGLSPSESVLARRLKDAGYATAICGKWHLGYEPKFLPRQHGFDYFFGPLGGGVDYFRHTEPGGGLMLYQNEEPAKRAGYLTDLLAEEATGFLKGAKDKPFFLYVPFTAPHSPFQGPEDRQSGPFPADDFNRGTRADYVKMVERLDDRIDAILRTLDELKLSENTLVVFASDNGGPALARNDPFSGRKGTTYEGGIRVPCILRWQGKLAAGGESRQVAITMDLTASILNAAGARSVPGTLDGIDIVAHLRQRKPELPRTLFWRQRRGAVTWRGVRDGDLKLVSKQDAAAREDWLFDLAADAGEKNDLLKSRSADAQRLQALLTQWEKDVQPTR
jgi:arylsulfatase A-like enzyme